MEIAYNIRCDLPSWCLPLHQIEIFKSGETIEDLIPVSWNLRVGDCIGYEDKPDLYGFAAVVDIGDEQFLMVDLSSCNFQAKVRGVICTFQKVS